MLRSHRLPSSLGALFLLLAPSPAPAQLFGLGTEAAADPEPNTAGAFLQATRERAARVARAAGEEWEPFTTEIEEVVVVRPYTNGQAWVRVKFRPGSTGAGFMTLSVDDKVKWTAPLEAGGGTKYYIFDHDWLQKKRLETVSGFIMLDVGQREGPKSQRAYVGYAGYPETFHKYSGGFGFGVTADAKIYQATLVTGADYVRYTEGASFRGMRFYSGGAVWTSELKLDAGWSWNPNGMQGGGYLKNPTGTYGAMKRKGTSSTKWERAPAVLRGSYGSRRGGIKGHYQSRSTIIYSENRGNWFHVDAKGTPEGVGHQLRVGSEFMLAGYSRTAPFTGKDFVVDLPGRIYSVNTATYSRHDRMTIRPGSYDY